MYGVVDHQNERTMPGAFNRAIKNPRRVKLLWQHDFKTPIGRITKLYEDDKGLRFRGKLNLKTDWGRNAYEALLAGDVDANSIGYNEVKGKNAVGEDGVKDLNDLDLWEVSTVSFPSNEAATVDEVKSIEPDEFKGALPYAKTPLAPEGQAWDGPGQVAAADVTGLRAMCACVDGDPTNKTSYKLPHHMASSGHACVWAGVRAAYAATQGARGGVQGCGGAESHLLKHYDDFGKPRPGKSMDEELQLKQGRVLSSKNEADLRQANDLSDQLGELIEGVLESATGKPVAEPADEGSDVAPKKPVAPVKAPGKAVDKELLLKLSKLNEQLKGIL